MSRKIDEAEQRMIQKRRKILQALICLCRAGVKSNLCAAVVVLIISALPAMSGQVGRKAPVPEKKPPDNTTVKVTKKPAGTRPTLKPQASHVNWQSQALTGLRNSFVQIPAGEFMMGSENGGSDEKPVHRVRISHSFEMGKYEVTQAQWEAVMGSNPSYFKGVNRPVENVLWDNAQQFIQRLNARNDGYVYRLPTEAEWEYACRAGSTEDYAVNLDAMAWYDDNSGGRTHPVGHKKPNAWGLYDMHGNVWEMCQDWYSQDYYDQSPSADPTGPSIGSDWVSRGGGWYNNATRLRSASRSGHPPDSSNTQLGFRLVRTSR
jgi:formylglycine-generating enzyme required for sulfatase activity